MHVSTVDIAGERMTGTDEQLDSATTPVVRVRYAFAFEVEGDLKFISHQDTLRMFKRAMARAKLPVSYSEGFNPQPRLSIPLPRPVGIASICEQLVVSMAEEIDTVEATSQFQAHAPIGLTITGGQQLKPRQKMLPTGVSYVLPIAEDDPENLEEKIEKILAEEKLIVSRSNPKKKETRTVDIRPFIDSLCIKNSSLAFRLHVSAKGTAKPSEIAGLLGYEAIAINHRIQRISIAWLAQDQSGCSDEKNVSSGNVDDASPRQDCT